MWRHGEKSEQWQHRSDDLRICSYQDPVLPEKRQTQTQGTCFTPILVPGEFKIRIDPLNLMIFCDLCRMFWDSDVNRLTRVCPWLEAAADQNDSECQEAWGNRWSREYEKGQPPLVASYCVSSDMISPQQLLSLKSLFWAAQSFILYPSMLVD